MRVNAKERKTNARQWYSLLTSSYNNKSAVIVKRYKSKNPNIFRVQLLACNTLGTPVVIAESVNGMWGCLYELFQNIEKSDIVKIYHENGFEDWLCENYRLYISYNDGAVLMFERKFEEEKDSNSGFHWNLMIMKNSVDLIAITEWV